MQLTPIILTILSRPERCETTFDILDTERSWRNKLIALGERQRQMKTGAVLGNFDTFEDLKVGHPSGLDLISYERKIIIELKNRTNTDNASSRKSNLDKLAKYKTEHPDFLCVYGNINSDTEQDTMRGSCKTIIHNEVEIKQYTGMQLLRLIMGDDTNSIIDFVRITIDDYYEHRA